VQCFCCGFKLCGIQASDHKAVDVPDNILWILLLLEHPNNQYVASVATVLAVLVLFTEPLAHSIGATSVLEMIGCYTAMVAALSHASNLVEQVAPAVEFPEKLVTFWGAVVHIEYGLL